MKLIDKLNKRSLVRGLPNLRIPKDLTCENCKRTKQVKSSFHHNKVVTTSKPLQLLHIDLFGPIRTISFGGKSFTFVIVDDFSRSTWIFLLAHRNKGFDLFSSFCRVFKEIAIMLLLELEVITKVNLKMKILNCFVMSMILSTRSLHQEHCNKILLLNRKIVQIKKWHEPF